MTNPANAIGYFAIIMPHENAFSGAFLIENPDTNSAVNLMMASAVASQGMNVYGALSATMVEGAVTGRPDIVSTAARAYSALTKKRFFYVLGWREPGGTRTDIREFKASTIDGAREELNALPEVLAIKQNIQESLRGQKGH